MSVIKSLIYSKYKTLLILCAFFFMTNFKEIESSSNLAMGPNTFNSQIPLFKLETKKYDIENLGQILSFDKDKKLEYLGN